MTNDEILASTILVIWTLVVPLDPGAPGSLGIQAGRGLRHSPSHPSYSSHHSHFLPLVTPHSRGSSGCSAPAGCRHSGPGARACCPGVESQGGQTSICSCPPNTP